jgi:hypothetical protein
MQDVVEGDGQAFWLSGISSLHQTQRDEHNLQLKNKLLFVA